jgi:asparagine synthase (glutamine-hydrolysing)
MSAIAGVWTTGSGPDPAASCQRMLRAQDIYGPDASDRWDGGEISLGRNLFRILPEDDHDRQPLSGGGGRLRLVADVRLDNRTDLEPLLEVPPALARETSDAALLLRAWERWGEASFERLIGAYAFALWDAELRRLILARDPMSLRPLHYHRAPGFIAFASMPKGLHALEEIPRRPDEETNLEFLALLHEYGSRTFFAGVERVEPGCFVEVRSAAVRKVRHWEPRRRPIRLDGQGEYVEAMREHLDRAVAAQLRGADRHVAAQLSAGLDSTAVATSAALQMAASGGSVTAFTAVPREGYQKDWKGLVDEGPHAAATAALYPNIEHVLVRTPGASYAAPLDRDHFLFDRPIFNICGAVWVHEINRQARNRGLRVMLTGLMGNFAFSYEGLDLLAERFAHGDVIGWLRLARKVVAAGTTGWRGAIYHSIAHWLPGPLFNRLEVDRGQYGGGLNHYSAVNPRAFSERELDKRSRERGLDPFFRPAIDTWADRVACLRMVDAGNYYKGYLGGWGLDYRDPTVDIRLIDFCLNVPTEQYIVAGSPRALTRAALKGRAADSALAEKRRGHQGADWHEIATADRTEIADWVSRLEGCGPAARALDLARLRRMLEQWPTDGWGDDNVRYPYRYALLRGLSVGHFLHRASGSNS